MPAFPESLRNSARRSLQRLGVEVREGTPVTHVAEGLVTPDAARRSALVDFGGVAPNAIQELSAGQDAAGIF